MLAQGASVPGPRGLRAEVLSLNIEDLCLFLSCVCCWFSSGCLCKIECTYLCVCVYVNAHGIVRATCPQDKVKHTCPLTKGTLWGERVPGGPGLILDSLAGPPPRPQFTLSRTPWGLLSAAIQAPGDEIPGDFLEESRARHSFAGGVSRMGRGRPRAREQG